MTASPPSGPIRPLVSVVIGSYNRRPFLQQAIETVRENGANLSYETIVVDGGSTDGSVGWLVKQKDVVTIVQHNRGEFRGQPIRRRSWGYFMNLGFKSAQGHYILMISDDCLLVPGAMERGVEHLQQLKAAGRKIGGGAFYFRNWPNERDYYVQRTLGGKLMVNHGLYTRVALEAVGFVDEDRYGFYKADGDLCLKMWEAGFEVVDCPGAYVEHFEGANRAVRKSNRELLARDREAYRQRWEGIFWDPEGPELRDQLTAAFDDPHRTASRFPSDAPPLPKRLVRRAGSTGKRALGHLTRLVNA
ncbi:MAG: glycosyltransferase [Chloroflexi bacterium]|nr:glycosyltransferase [Chloroflexota bacterium]